jgi:hypothetical protein
LIFCIGFMCFPRRCPLCSTICFVTHIRTRTAVCVQIVRIWFELLQYGPTTRPPGETLTIKGLVRVAASEAGGCGTRCICPCSGSGLP